MIQKTAQSDPYYQNKLDLFLNKLGLEYHNISLFILAFIHRSVLNERADFAPEHNERLEFLGDAVLELVITEELFKNFPEKQEGELTDMRSALVRGKNLAEIAHSLDFNSQLILGKGEEKSGGRHKDYILANTMESFLGALYLDGGIDLTRTFILSHIYGTLPKILSEKLCKDFKTLLQEYTQAQFDQTPSYEVAEENGPDHAKDFKIEVYLGEKCIGTGNGSSKKKGQESAAENAYLKLNPTS